MSVLVLLFSILYSISFTQQNCRDRNKWPFASTSIWNMPIGSLAEFGDAYIFNKTIPNFFWGDIDYYFRVTPDDPYFPWYNQGHWGQPCTAAAYCDAHGKYLGEIQFPQNITMTYFCHNNAAAILQSDNVTLLQMQPLYKCNLTSPILAMNYAEKYNVSILGDGIWGAHGGSDLSSIGGTIRLGELTTNINDYTTMKHALKIELYSNEYLYNGNPNFVWPASKGDHSGLPTNPKYFVEGALLSIPSTDEAYNILKGLKTPPGKKIMWTMINYGAYYVDNTATPVRGTLCVENGVFEEFQETYNTQFNATKGQPFYDDLLVIFQNLKVVTNNGPDSIGGGGKALQPLAPPICD